MPKPIGNITANLKSNDKVSGRIKVRFETRSSLEALAASKPVVAAAKPKPVKYKKRKK